MDNGGAFTDRLFAQAAFSEGATALDIGCGTGEVTFRLSKLVGAGGEVTGLDLNASALERASAM
ncbi:MAG: methyltransferase domain-containing protein [Pseudomonadota bacterium]